VEVLAIKGKYALPEPGNGENQTPFKTRGTLPLPVTPRMGCPTYLGKIRKNRMETRK